MKKIFLLLISIFQVLLYPQYKLDTLSTRIVGPGTIHTKINVTSIPWTINVLEVDLTNPFITLESVKAKDMIVGKETTTAMASRSSYDSHTVIGAINADFFGSDGTPINIQIDNGEIVRSPISLSTIGFDDLNNPMLDIVKLDCKLFTRNGSIAISDVNSTRLTDYLILYNSFIGASTVTNQWGTEYLISPINEWSANDTISCIVETSEKRTGNMIIPKGKAVLSGHGAAELFLDNNVQPGDTVKLFPGVQPGLNKLKVLLGGFPKIISNGVDYVDEGYNEEGGPPHTYERHPRTAIGFSGDSTKLFLVAVDGRQSISAGMTLHELAGVMIQLGVHWGLNLDGGGSTTIVVRGKIENSPSDGSERSVSNALVVVSSETVIPQSLIISPEKAVIDSSGTIDFSADLIDQYNVPSSIKDNEYNWQVSDPAIGTIDSMGVFKGLSNGKTKVVVEYKGVSDTAEVEVQIGKDYKLLNSIESLDEWIFSGKNIDSVNTKFSFNTDNKTSGSGSIQIDYNYVYENKIPYIYLEPLIPIPVYGFPELILMDGKSDSLKHKIYFYVIDSDSSLFKAIVNKYFQRSWTFDTLTCPLKNLTALGINAKPVYPIAIKKIEIQLAGGANKGQTYTGTLYIDNLRVKYPGATTSVEGYNLLPVDFALYQNFPNPFNPITKITVDVSVPSILKAEVFNILGEKIKVLVDKQVSAGRHILHFDAAGLPSGVYICKVEAGQYSKTIKMMLNK